MKTVESPNAALISYRADILAQVAMTRREDIRLSKFDIGQLKTASTPEVNFIGTINPDDDDNVAGVFAVAVWGTEKPINNEEAATRWMNKRWGDNLTSGKTNVFHLPTVALLFSMVGDTGYYAWILEPESDPEKNVAQLAFAQERLKCRTMDKKALDEIVNKIKGWYRLYPVSRIAHQRSFSAS